MTENFLKDLEIACETMDLRVFITLFDKYDLSFIEDYNGVLRMIKTSLSGWNRPEVGTEIVSIISFDSKCMFCEFGKTVKVYKWTYRHKLLPRPLSEIAFPRALAFYFGFENKQLVEFGVCNGYLNKEEVEILNS